MTRVTSTACGQQKRQAVIPENPGESLGDLERYRRRSGWKVTGKKSRARRSPFFTDVWRRPALSYAVQSTGVVAPDFVRSFLRIPFTDLREP